MLIAHDVIHRPLRYHPIFGANNFLFAACKWLRCPFFHIFSKYAAVHQISSKSCHSLCRHNRIDYSKFGRSKCATLRWDAKLNGITHKGGRKKNNTVEKRKSQFVHLIRYGCKWQNASKRLEMLQNLHVVSWNLRLPKYWPYLDSSIGWRCRAQQQQ